MEFKTADDGTIYAYDETGKQVGWVMTSCVPKQREREPANKQGKDRKPKDKK